MSETVAEEPLSRGLHGLHDARVGLAIGLVALGLLFHAEIGAAIKTWIDSTAYNHCFLVIPIAGYLIWDRRHTLHGLNANPIPRVALAAIPLGIIWLAAERLGIMEGRQLAVISMVEVLFLAMLGWRLWYAMLGPLLYLYFLVPFGEFLTPQLQDVTAWFIRHGVDILGIPAYIDGYIIEIPEGTFFVAEACAGLRFLIASIAFGVLYALMMYRSPLRRTLFIIASIIMPIIANGFRALGIVGLGHILGSAEAAAADHVLYGWIFFSIVILLLIVIGLPFRQDEIPGGEMAAPMNPDAGPRDLGAARHGLLAGLALAALAALGPIAVLGLNQAAAAPDVALRPIGLAPSCVNQGAPTVLSANASVRAIVQRVTCGETTMDVLVEAFSPRSTAGPINAERRRLTRIPDADDITEVPMTTTSGAILRPWRLVRSNQPSFIAAVGVWINGEPATPGLGTRLELARTSVTGGSHAPILIAITPAVDWSKIDMRLKQQLENQLVAVLSAHPEISDHLRSIANAAR